MRLYRYGDPLAGGPERTFNDDQARFWSKVVKTDSCWVWTGSKNSLGYGQIVIGGASGRKVKAHRYAYESVIGPIPDGLELDHLCSNPSCVNPAHLEPVTHLENVRRGRGAEAARKRAQSQTHCKRGHEFDYHNGKQRICKKCRALRARERNRSRAAG